MNECDLLQRTHRFTLNAAEIKTKTVLQFFKTRLR